MRRSLVILVCGLALCSLGLSACGDNPPPATATAAPLPPPQVLVENIPSPTPLPPTETVTPEPQPTATETPQLIAWPTVDEEAYLISLIENLLDEIDQRLRSTDTQLKP